MKLFEGVAQAAPFLDGAKLKITKRQIGKETAQSFVASKKSGEAALMAYFFVLCEEMAAEARAAREKSSSPADIPQEIYDLADHQGSAVPGSPHKPDGVLYYSKHAVKDIHAVHMCVEAKITPTPDAIPDLTMGQILDYMNALWVNQPTRTFAPVLYVHGRMLTLFVFTRRPWFRIELADKFGHFCDVDTDSQYIRFNHADDDDRALKDAIMTTPNSPNALSLKSRIQRTVNPRSRLAYLFDTMYMGNKAVLKLSWTPKNRLPEGAVYDILREGNVQGVPDIYDSGLLLTDFFGYRLEYIILEHCGESIGSYVNGYRKDDKTIDPGAHLEVKQFIHQITSCLVQARVHGILHRDISDGNIAVRDGKAKVIDWGYAKVIVAGAENILGVDPTVANNVSQKWTFNKDDVFNNENTFDPLTGTVYFMSVPVLFGMKRRGLFDDIESLFYVVLRAFADPKECFGFNLYTNETLALTRVGILGCDGSYLKHFGVGGLGSLEPTIEAMFRYLFYSGDSYIGHKLISDERYERLSDPVLAARFMDKEAVDSLRRFLPDTPAEAGPSAKRKRNTGTAGSAAGTDATDRPKRARGRGRGRGRT
ncbi:hypothetical protein LPJ81_004168 [Coemansia sp. IMI 209127]|nr:hypothetical protein LPJ81_004168 [Coemansia sp. IMI 209127]